MFGKLFGAKPAAAKKEAPVNIEGASEKLRNQIENIEMRKKKVENDQNKFKAAAMEKFKKGDKAGAALAMKKMKMKEKEILKLEGQELVLEQQANQIEST